MPPPQLTLHLYKSGRGRLPVGFTQPNSPQKSCNMQRFSIMLACQYNSAFAQSLQLKKLQWIPSTNFTTLYGDVGASLMAQTNKESACKAETLSSIPGSGRSPGEGNGYLSTSVFLPREFHGQRSLAGYSSWGRKESDTIE